MPCSCWISVGAKAFFTRHFPSISVSFRDFFSTFPRYISALFFGVHHLVGQSVSLCSRFVYFTSTKCLLVSNFRNHFVLLLIRNFAEFPELVLTMSDSEEKMQVDSGTGKGNEAKEEPMEEETEETRQQEDEQDEEMEDEQNGGQSIGLLELRNYYIRPPAFIIDKSLRLFERL